MFFQQVSDLSQRDRCFLRHQLLLLLLDLSQTDGRHLQEKNNLERIKEAVVMQMLLNGIEQNF